MPFALTRKEIRDICGATYYGRGLGYHSQKRVRSLEWIPQEQSIEAQVAGSGRKIYRQEIVFLKENGYREFDGSCSCPVGWNCKHVVAVLLEWLELRSQTMTAQQPGPDRSRAEFNRWLEQTAGELRNERADGFPDPGHSCLLYLLHVDERYHPAHIFLDSVKSRRLKKGGWGKPAPFPLSQLQQHYYTPAGVSSGDLEIAKLLRKEIYSGDRLAIEGDIGVLVLLRLLRSGRCFFESSDNPALTLGPSREANFQWLKNDSGRTGLEMTLTGLDDRWHCLATVPPWYLAPETHQCGPIEQPLPPALFHALRNLPPVAAEQLNEFSSFLLQQLPADSIPLPIELKLNRRDLPPTPILMLHAVIGPTGNRHHLARVRFAYGPVSLPPLAAGQPELQFLRHGEEDWQIRRHPRTEANLLRRLEDCDLRAAPPQLAAEGERDLYFAARSLEDSALAWKQFLEKLPQLEAEGWRIDIDRSFQLSFETLATLQADIDDSGQGWFEIGLNIEHDGHRLPLLPLLTRWLENHAPGQPLLYHLEGNRWLEIPPSLLEPVVDTLVELYDDPQLSSEGRLKLARPQAHGLLELENRLADGGHRFDWQGGQKLRRLAEKLKNFQGIAAVSAPAGLKAALRNYQRQGLAWLQFLREYGFNGVLADDMGLGKTIQTLAHLLLEKEAGRLDSPALIVAPTSVLSNWQREAGGFTPDLKCLILHGPSRARHYDQLDDYDLIITSYSLLSRDLEQHLRRDYHSLILDEAQAIKNPRAKSAQAACDIKAAHRLCLTGTPLENHLGELWSLFQFLMPGFLGQQKKFNQLFRAPIEKHHDPSRRRQLQQRLAPFILRRNKSQVVRELPPKTLMIRAVELNAAQARLYESLRIAMTERIGKLLEKKGIKNSRIEILDALLKLRQVCCDPRLVKLESARKVKHSAKLELLLEMLDELLDEGRKVLVFSQFTSMLALIEDELKERHIRYSKLTGQTRKRDAAIAAFQDGDAAVFLISLKAGGVGLNLTAADTVIHYDPWWNPAVENQATDRAHRIGQQKPVFVYKLVAGGTLEEKILQLQQKKQELADGVYQKTDQPDALPGIRSEDLLSLLTPFSDP